jgi:hypothetical protein
MGYFETFFRPLSYKYLQTKAHSAMSQTNYIPRSNAAFNSFLGNIIALTQPNIAA